MNDRIFYVFGGFLILLLVGAGVYLNQNNLGNPTDDLQIDNIDTEFLLDDDEGNTIFSYDCQKGKTALEVLLLRNDFVETEESDLGAFVTSIGNTPQGNGKYWLYSVDNKEATISASAYVCQDSEKIRWELK